MGEEPRRDPSSSAFQILSDAQEHAEDSCENRRGEGCWPEALNHKKKLLQKTRKKRHSHPLFWGRIQASSSSVWKLALLCVCN